MIDAIDWTQIPLVGSVVAILIARAWQSRELTNLRDEVLELDNRLFEERRNHKRTQKELESLREEIKKTKGESHASGEEKQGEGGGDEVGQSQEV